IYIPGGRAAYPSTVLMTAVPARVAGVKEIVLVTPPGADGSVNPVVLAAARGAGVTEGWRIGGAQAVAALAYGTATIRRVDKIVGPGNIYVALAKTRVFGVVGIDMMAGPSEVVVVADAAAEPDWIAADLLAQAEHDPMARAVLITDAAALMPRVEKALAARLGTEDFVKRSSVLEYSPSGLAAALPHLTTLSRIEGLTAHGSAAEARAKKAEGERT